MTKIPTVSEQPMIVARDCFRALGLSDTTGYALIAKGQFPLRVQRIGGRWMVSTRALRRFLDLED